MRTATNLWYTALTAIPSTPPVLRGNRIAAPIQVTTHAQSQAALEMLDLGDGHPIWHHIFDNAFISGVTTASEALLVSLTSTDFLRGEGALVALDGDGVERWRWAPGVQQVSAPAVMGNTVFVVTDATTLVAVDVASGEEQHRQSLSATASRDAPAVVGDTVLIPCRGPHLLAMSLDGSPRWRYDAPDAVWLDHTPVAVGDRIFTVTSTGQCLALNLAGGSLLWQIDAGAERKPLTPPITDGGYLFVGARDGLHALDLDGQAVWHLLTSRRITAAPIVIGGVVYATCHDHNLYALDAASGKLLWQYEVDRRIEVSPLILPADGNQPALAVIADRGGTVTCLQRPLSAREHEKAGHWVEAAAAYVDIDSPARAAPLFEAAGQWAQAADLWAKLENALRQAEALQRYVRFQEERGMPLGTLAKLWTTIAELYESQDELALAENCRREVSRCLQRPELALEIEHDVLVHNTWTMVSFIVRNIGFGPAHSLVIRAAGEQFDGQVTCTQRLIKLDAGERSVQPLDIKPLEYGPSVPVTVTAEYADYKGEIFAQKQRLRLPVSKSEPAQRARTRTQVIRASRMFVNLEIRIFRRRAEGYPVEITLGIGQTFPQGYINAAIANWTASGDTSSDGKALFEALIADAKLREAWSRCLGQAPRRRVRLRIDPAAQELHRLPWELLQEDGNWLAADAHMPFSRYLPVPSPLRARVEERPLRVLVAIANPTDLSNEGLVPIDVRGEKSALASAFGGLASIAGAVSAVHVDFLEPPVTLSRLGAALQKGYHILHVVSHGRFDVRRGRGALYLEDVDCLVELVNDAAFSDMLERLSVPPRLVVLAACESAAISIADARSTRDAFQGFAPRLIKAGISAVVAMQASVSQSTARKLSTAFYNRLLDHGTVDLALNEARSLLLTGNRPDAAVPALYMRLKDGQLFHA